MNNFYHATNTEVLDELYDSIPSVCNYLKCSYRDKDHECYLGCKIIHKKLKDNRSFTINFTKKSMLRYIVAFCPYKDELLILKKIYEN